MNFIKLVINELVKNLKKKSTIIFFIFSMIAVIASCLIVKFKDYTYLSNRYQLGGITSEFSIKQGISQNEVQKAKAEGKYKDMYQEIIDLEEKVLEVGVNDLLSAPYKKEIYNNIISEIKTLYNINEEEFKEKYDNQKDKINSLDYLLFNGNFEEYIEFNKEQIEKKYKEELIDEETYNKQIEEQNINLRFEIKN